jgi:LysR family transcriptional regulator, nitrogen assimilation regulatory protein
MDSLAQIKKLVRRGSGFTILALALAFNLVQCGELVSSRISDVLMSRPIYLVRNHAKATTEACKAVERITVEVVKDLAKRKIWNVSGNNGEDAV